MLTAANAMETRVDAVSPEMGLVELERKLLMLGRGGFPVVEKGKLIGIVSRSDVVRTLSVERSAQEQLSDFYRDFEDPHRPPIDAGDAGAIGARVGERAAKLTVRDAMIRRVISVERDQPLSEVARLMTAGHIHRLPVLVDGALVGLVTTLDIVRLFAEGRLVSELPEGASAQRQLAAAAVGTASFGGEGRLEGVRVALEQRLDRLLARARAIEEDLRSEHDRDSQERAAERENDQVLERLEASERRHIAEIRRALARLAAGEYEICEQCGAPVGVARQAALPEATLCLACA